MRRVTAAILVDNGRLLICQRPPGDHLAGLWELPGGKVELDEPPQVCLARELREELGIEADVGELFASSEYSYDRGAIVLVCGRGNSFGDRASWPEVQILSPRPVPFWPSQVDARWMACRLVVQ
jgi:mutator protein MutT